jgi:F-box and WD-40 domain protein CDC4
LWGVAHIITLIDAPIFAMTTETSQGTTLPKVIPDHRDFPGHASSIVTVLRLDAENIYAANDEGFIHIYDIATGRLKKRLEGHMSGIWAMQLRQNVLVTGSTDSTVRIWDLQALQESYIFKGHVGTVRALEIVEPVLDPRTGDYDPPYPLIVSGSRDATLRVWKLPGLDTPVSLQLMGSLVTGK